MTRIYSSIQIPLPQEIVFNYVTTPGNWPQWHPSSLSVRGATDHSLEVGEQVTEEFLVAGRRGQTTWTVVERVFPQKWAINANFAGGRGHGKVTYTSTPKDNGTIFEREFTYQMGSLRGTIIDWLVLRQRVDKESKQAVQQLKQALLKQQKIVTNETP